MPANRTFILFAHGFRVFFLLAGWYAVIALLAWLWMYDSTAQAIAGLPPFLWHGHEMLFGFVAAAIGGFLLTAVPNWTGRGAYAGAPLAVLAAAWLLGRLAFAVSGLPAWLIAVLELAYLPLLIALVAPALSRARNRNTPLLAVLGMFWACDAGFVFAMSRPDPESARLALHTPQNIELLLITVIGGRIVPAFTGNALRKAGVEIAMPRNAMLERLTIGSMVVLLLVDLFWPASTLSAAIAAIAGCAHLSRLVRWHGWLTLRAPIVWVLHVGYLWLPLGLLMKAGQLLWPGAWSTFWLHALAAGAAGTMILAVMSRASLGHTGRPLEVDSSIAVAYVLLTLGIAMRVAGPAALPLDYRTTITLAGLLWAAAFFLFSLKYTPIFLKPRVDGKPG